MNPSERWVECLPSDAPERQLLLVAARDQPDPAVIERGWHDLSLSLAMAPSTIADVASPQASAVQATGAVAVPLAAKITAIGLLSGIALLGVVAALPRHAAKPNSGTLVPSAPALALPTASAHPTSVNVGHAESTPTRSVPPAARVLAVGKGVAQSQKGVSPRRAALPVDAEMGTKQESLAAQAHEVAAIKRLLDTGASADAAIKLQSAIESGRLTALAEDRDALYVEALVKAQRGAEARRVAKQFLTRYPASPWRTRIQELAGSE